MVFLMNNTMAYYEANAEEYINRTKDIDMSEIYSKFLEYVPKNGYILDLGCGSGRDSKYFNSNGYKVLGIDASKKFCDHLKNDLKIDSQVMNLEDFYFENEFDGVWACASLLHLKKYDVIKCLHHISYSLKENGTLYASFKYGDAERIDDTGRFYSDFTEMDIPVLFNEGTKLKCVDWWTSKDKKEGSDETWLNVICKKI